MSAKIPYAEEEEEDTLQRSRSSVSPSNSLDDGRSRSSSETSIDELDPLHRAPTYSSSDDLEDYDASHTNGEKLRLHRPPRSKRRRHVKSYQTREAQAFQWRPSPALLRLTALPRWMSTKRASFPVLLLALFASLTFIYTHGIWVYKKSTIDGASPPWYPSPRGGTFSRWEESYRKAAQLVKGMSLVEKVNVTTGTGWMMGMCVGNTGPAEGVGFPSLCLQDGPLGLRFADNITASPAGITVGATWNKNLMFKRGKMLGTEARSKGVNAILGPNVGALGRIPAGGRNWEGFGIDPVLQGIAAAETIRGIQEEGVMGTIKHFVANEQEHYRQAWEWGLPDAISSNLDDRTLHELYAWPFADAIKVGVVSVMCSYNQVNNSYACQNSKLINGILKDEMGFQGFVQSDWLAQRSGVASALSGLDMSMPGDGERWMDGKPFWGPHLTLAALNGSLPMERLNDMVTRVIAAWYQVGQDDNTTWPTPPPEGKGGPNFSSWTDEEFGLLHPGSDDRSTGLVNRYVDAGGSGTFSHSALARRIAAEGTVLLKNHDKILPLSRKGFSQADEPLWASQRRSGKMNVAVLGQDAITSDGGPNVCPDRACNKGTLAQGWGSGTVEYPYLVSPLEALQREFHADDVDLTVYPTNAYPADNTTGIENEDLCLVFVNAAGGEGYASFEDIEGDRNDLELQKGGNELINDVALNCGKKRGGTRDKTIVVIHAIGPVILESFIDDSNVGAVLLANLPGQESGNALADVLFGRANPSGHLPYTIGKALSDYGPGAEVIYDSHGTLPQQNFTEGLLVDYRWFDAMKITPRFEFGYGLSYTTFKLENLRIIPDESLEDGRPAPLPVRKSRSETRSPSYSNTTPSPAEAVFPRGWRRLKKYVYPYINSVEDVKPDPDPPYKSFPRERPSEAGGGEGGNPSLWDELVTVEVDVLNEGERAGQAVVQLYIVFPQEVWEYPGETFERAELYKPSPSPSPPPSPPPPPQTEEEEEPMEPPESLVPPQDQEATELPESPEPAYPQEPPEPLNLPGSPGPPAAPELPKEAPRPDAPARPDVAARPDLPPGPISSAGLGTPARPDLPIRPDRRDRTNGSERPAKRQEPSRGPERIVFPPRVLRGFEKVHLRGSISVSSPGSSFPNPDVPLESYRDEPPSEVRNEGSHEDLKLEEERSEERDVVPTHKMDPVRAGDRDRKYLVHHQYTQPPTQYATGEMKPVTFVLTRRDLSYWSAKHQNWVLPAKGSFGIEVGFSSRDIKARGRLF